MRGFSFLASLIMGASGISPVWGQATSPSTRLEVSFKQPATALAIAQATRTETPSVNALTNVTNDSSAIGDSAFTPSNAITFKERVLRGPKSRALNVLDSPAAASPSPFINVSRPAIITIPDGSSSDTGTQLATADARDIACAAGRNWLPAIQLRQHAKALDQLYCNERDDCTRQSVRALSQFLRQQAEHQQDVGSANALKAYYSLAGTNAQLVLLAESDAQIAAKKEQQNKLMQQGIAAAVDLTSFDREQIDLNVQQLQLQQRLKQLAQSLVELGNAQIDWTSAHLEELDIQPSAVDLEYLQQFALSHRHDLAAVNGLARQINSESAPILAGAVAGFTGMVSLPLPALCLYDRLLGRKTYPGLANNLNQEVALAAETLAKSIRQSVFEKSTALELAYQEVELADAMRQSWQKRIAQLQRLAELGESRAAEIALAEASLLASEAAAIHKKLQAKLAEVELSEACGGLHGRCCRGEAWLITGR